MFLNDMPAIENKYGNIAQAQGATTAFSKSLAERARSQLNLNKPGDFNSEKYIGYLGLMAKKMSSINPSESIDNQDYKALKIIIDHYKYFLEEIPTLKNNQTLEAYKEALKAAKAAFVEGVEHSGLNDSLKRSIKEEFEMLRRSRNGDKSLVLQNIKDGPLKINIGDEISRNLRTISAKGSLRQENVDSENSESFPLIPITYELVRTLKVETEYLKSIQKVLDEQALRGLTDEDKEDLKSRIRHYEKSLNKFKTDNPDDTRSTVTVREQNAAKGILDAELSTLKKAAGLMGVSPNILKTLDQKFAATDAKYNKGALNQMRTGAHRAQRSFGDGVRAAQVESLPMEKKSQSITIDAFFGSI